MAVIYNQLNYIIRNDDGLVYFDGNIPPTTTTSTTSTTTTTNPYYIGASYGGGYIGYIFQPSDYGYITGKTSGIVVASTDATSAVWGCSSTHIVTSRAIGYGLTNTTAILSGCSTSNIAARIATGYTSGGYTDWFLGSDGDMNVICSNKAYLPGFDTSGVFYSTSSENTNINYAVGRYFSTCNDGNLSKNTSAKVRPIRYFSI